MQTQPICTGSHTENKLQPLTKGLFSALATLKNAGKKKKKEVSKSGNFTSGGKKKMATTPTAALIIKNRFHH